MPLLSTRGAGSAKAFGLTAGSIKVTAEYVVWGGGGGGGGEWGVGGSAGGAAYNYPSPTGVVLTAGTYPVTIGQGGSGGSPFPSKSPGVAGTSSTWNGYTGGGGQYGNSDGYGVGADTTFSGTPQSFGNGQGADSPVRCGGGGGTGGAGQPGPNGKTGGAGLSLAIYAPGSNTYGGGGGGGGREGSGPPGPGGGGTGAGGNPGGPGSPATASTGSGGGGGSGAGNSGGGGGAAGFVVIRVPSKASPKVSVSPGTNTKTSAPNGDAVCTFTVSGTLTVT